VVILRAHVHSHVPCRREVDLERVQLRDQLLAMGVLMMRSRSVSSCAASAPVFSSITSGGSRAAFVGREFVLWLSGLNEFP
jgi:hypothetical protein